MGLLAGVSAQPGAAGQPISSTVVDPKVAAELSGVGKFNYVSVEQRAESGEQNFIGVGERRTQVFWRNFGFRVVKFR